MQKIERLARRVLEKAGVEFREYNQDGLRSYNNHDFMRDPKFIDAYTRGVTGTGQGYPWHWRVHVGLWAAQTAASLPGDFVECGVNKGFLSSSIMRFLNWNSVHKTFWLLDTFAGLDERLVSEEERSAGMLDKGKRYLESGFYASGVESVRKNFAEWKDVKIIQGTIPDTLTQVTASKVAYLHIDLNCSAPEVASIEYFWPKLTTGAVVLLDDYAFQGYETSKLGMDEFAKRYGIAIASLPTGQGLIIKTK